MEVLFVFCAFVRPEYERSDCFRCVSNEKSQIKTKTTLNLFFFMFKNLHHYLSIPSFIITWLKAYCPFLSLHQGKQIITCLCVSNLGANHSSFFIRFVPKSFQTVSCRLMLGRKDFIISTSDVWSKFNSQKILAVQRNMK